MNPPDHGSPNPTSRTPSIRRPRAPTITIDTSAVSAAPGAGESHQLNPLSSPFESDSPTRTKHEQGSKQRTPPLSTEPSGGALRATASFESRDSRPTSPHNVSSPASKWSQQPHNFLSVPQARSRGNSVDSDDLTHSTTSYGGDTYIPSPTSSQNGEARHTSTAHSNDHLLPDDEALKPDPGTESDFEVDENCFAFSPGQLNKLFNPKSLGALHALGGLGGLENGLRTDRISGLSVDETNLEGSVDFGDATKTKNRQDAQDSEQVNEPRPPRRAATAATASNVQMSAEAFRDRKRIYSDNILPEKKSKSFLELAWIAFNDKVLLLLTVAAVVSLSVGIYQSVKPTRNGDQVAWVEGVAIVAAIVIVVVVGALNDWQKERSFLKLNKVKDDRAIKVVRSGKIREVSVHEILVGDIVHMEAGDLIPVDGIYISGHNITCDESAVTGESDQLKKTPGDVAFRAIENHESLHKVDPFIMSGTHVTEGVGTFLVTSTGINSSYGKMLLSLQEDPQVTPLQIKLNKLASYIAKLGLSAGGLLFLATLIRFCVRLARDASLNTGQAKGQAFLQILITAVTIIVVAVPEGLPLAVTLALAFATNRMLKDNNLVRQLKACETMGNATTICSDKTGTLTQNEMTVVAGTVGTKAQFGNINTKPEDSASAESPSTSKEIGMVSKIADEFPAQTMKVLSDEVKELLKQSIVVNSTAFEGQVKGRETYIGSKTETALLLFARDHLGMLSLSEERSDADVVQLVPFDSQRKCMAATIRLPSGKYRMFVKGASEIMLAQCSKIVRDPLRDIMEGQMTKEDVEMLNATINTYAEHSLRTIGLLYKDFEEWPPRGIPVTQEDPKAAVFEKVFKDMTFLAVVGIQDPLRDGVTKAVKVCQEAGVFVRMVTGDNIVTAKAIASECGIYTAGGMAMEGPQFRRMNKTQMNQVLPRLQILARSSPDDKRILVRRLKELGETVAVTGDGTNDAAALKTADVGFSMGITGTEIAREASAIILMDDNFASIVKAMMWGRTVNDAVKKFLQFQVTVNITAVVLTFISAVSNDDGDSVLSAVQLLWVNLIMDTFAALALATDSPTETVLERKPEPKSAPLITITMWKMIIAQAVYQLVVTFILYFVGSRIRFLYAGVPDSSLQGMVSVLVFNTFVWMQIFNQYNCRRLDNKFNILEGIHKNRFFIGIQLIIVAGQVLIMFVGGAAFNLSGRPTGTMWAGSIILGLLSVPFGMLIRLIPDHWCVKLVPNFLKRKKTPELRVTEEGGHFHWNPAIEEIRDELLFLKMIRGGRLSVLKYKLQNPRELLPRSRSGSRSPSRSRTNSIPRTPNEEQGVKTPALTPGPPTPESHRSFQPRKRARSRSNSAFGPAAAMAGIVAGSIAGWSPVERREGDAFGRFPLQDRSDLEGYPGVEVHPRTRPDDPVLADPEGSSNPPSQMRETRPSFEGLSRDPTNNNN